MERKRIKLLNKGDKKDVSACCSCGCASCACDTCGIDWWSRPTKPDEIQRTPFSPADSSV